MKNGQKVFVEATVFDDRDGDVIVDLGDGGPLARMPRARVYRSDAQPSAWRYLLRLVIGR